MVCGELERFNWAYTTALQRGAYDGQERNYLRDRNGDCPASDDDCCSPTHRTQEEIQDIFVSQHTPAGYCKEETKENRE
jgi:hypothetical protein